MSDAEDEVLRSVAGYFSLLAEPSRLKVMHTICDRERSVGDIVAETGLSQTNVSRQLRVLHDRGVVGRRKQGALAFYRVVDTTVVELCRIACSQIASRIDGQRPLKRALLRFMPDQPASARRDTVTAAAKERPT
jgi:DNA-binding transcriptional ArsR family regulator